MKSKRTKVDCVFFALLNKISRQCALYRGREWDAAINLVREGINIVWLTRMAKIAVKNTSEASVIGTRTIGLLCNN